MGGGGVVAHCFFIVLLVKLVKMTVIIGTNVAVFTRQRC